MGLAKLPELAGLVPIRTALHTIWETSPELVGLGRPPLENTAGEIAAIHSLIGERDRAGKDVIKAVVELRDRGQTKIWDKHFKAWAGNVVPEVATQGRALLDSVRTNTDTVSASVKDTYRRPRPFITDPTIKIIVAEPHSFSYPSEHASDSFANATIMSFLDPTDTAKYHRQAEDIAMASVVAGVHHPSDIIAGATLGHAAAYHGLVTSPFATAYSAGRMQGLLRGAAA